MNPSKLGSTKQKIVVLSMLLSQALSFSAVMAQSSGAVHLAGQVVFTNLAGKDGQTVDQRTQDIQTKLNDALVASNDRSAASVNIVYYNGLPVVTLGGYQVAIVDEQNAKAAGTTPTLLAQKWADGLRQALSNKANIDGYVAQLTGGASQANSAPNQAYNAAPSQYSQSTAPYGGAPSSGIPPQYPQGGPQYGSYSGSAGGVPQSGGVPQYSGYGQNNMSPPGYQPGAPTYQGGVAYAPAGLVMPVTLSTSISTVVARSGDLVQAQLNQDIPLGNSVIPAGSVVIGQVTDAEPGRHLSRSGALAIKFNALRLPSGVQVPMQARLLGDVGKYAQNNDGTMRGEHMGAKAFGIGGRTLLGAGLGAGLGTAVGAIAGGGHGAGAGAWSGTAIGGGLGLADGLIIRKGREVTIPSGTRMQVQLESAVSIPVTPPQYPSMQYSQQPPANGNF